MTAQIRSSQCGLGAGNVRLKFGQKASEVGAILTYVRNGESIMKVQKRDGIMLAYPAEEKRIKNFPLVDQEDGTKKRVMFHQPKLNGERSRIEWFDDIPYIISSYGNDFRFLEHLQEQLTKVAMSLGEARKYDGEIYVHGWSREEIDSALRRTKNRNSLTPELEFHIFDIQDENKLQYDRVRELGELEQLVAKLGLGNIKVVEYGVCDENNWLAHCQNYCEDGYEGIILRNPFAGYEEKRVPGLLKFKPTETDSYIIAGVNEAISQTGVPKGMVGSFTVYSKDEPGSNVTFNVGAGKLNHDKRRLYFDHQDKLVGKYLLVKHEMLRTTNQVPIAAVAVDVIGGIE